MTDRESKGHSLRLARAQSSSASTIALAHSKPCGLLVAIGFACAVLPGCGDGEGTSDTPPGSGGTGGQESGATGGTEPSETGGESSSGGSMASGGSGATGNTGAGGSDPVEYTEVGVCGQRGQGTVNAGEFSGYEEFYIIGEEGFGDDVCVVRFDVTRVGAAPAGCDDPTADRECLWTHLVQYDNPQIITDVDGVCANSELGFDAARTAEVDGSQAAYGFVSEYAGHNSVLMRHDPATETWDPFGNATWDPDTGAFRFDKRDGYCNY